MVANELIRVEVNENGTKLVSARDLYLGLELNKSNWSRWYPKNIVNNEFFLENQDFVGVRHRDEGNNEIQDFAISLDFAKHIAMMARTRKSHEYRNYFIECEKENIVLNTIIDNTTDDNAKLERNKYRFSTGRTIKTFTNCTPIDMPKLREEFMDYIKDMDSEDRKNLMQSAIKGIDRAKDFINATNVHMLPLLMAEQTELIKDRAMLINRMNGGIKGYQTRQLVQKNNIINSLTNQVDNLTPPSIEKFVEVDYHAISNNDLYDGTGVSKVKQWKYKKWISNFPSAQIPPMEYWEDVDFEKPVRLYLKFVLVSERYDIPNMGKGFQDQLFMREMGIDDNVVKACYCELEGYCDSFQEAKTYYYIENIK